MGMQGLQLKNFVIAGIKRYYRNPQALFFSLFIPILIMVIFGVLNLGNNVSVSVGLVDQSSGQVATGLNQAIQKVSAFKIQTGTESSLRDKLNKSQIDMLVVIPKSVGSVPIHPGQVEVYTASGSNTAKAGAQIVGEVVSSFNDSMTHTPKLISVKQQSINTNDLTYIDFLIPGVIAMSVMQMAMFSVAFGFVELKKRGVLRRLKATPVRPAYFLAGEVVTRLITTLMQVSLLLLLGVAFFKLHLVGSILSIACFALLGGLTFLAFGFAIAGWAKDEDQAAPLANLVAMPMMFLSGVFFSRSAMPGWLQGVTSYMPLTYLADGIRHVANDGYGLWHLRGDLLGLVIWGIISYIVASKVFRWE